MAGAYLIVAAIWSYLSYQHMDHLLTLQVRAHAHTAYSTQHSTEHTHTTEHTAHHRAHSTHVAHAAHNTAPSTRTYGHMYTSTQAQTHCLSLLTRLSASTASLRSFF